MLIYQRSVKHEIAPCCCKWLVNNAHGYSIKLLWSSNVSSARILAFISWRHVQEYLWELNFPVTLIWIICKFVLFIHKLRIKFGNNWKKLTAAVLFFCICFWLYCNCLTLNGVLKLLCHSWSTTFWFSRVAANIVIDQLKCCTPRGVSKYWTLIVGWQVLFWQHGYKAQKSVW